MYRSVCVQVHESVWIQVYMWEGVHMHMCAATEVSLVFHSSGAVYFVLGKAGWPVHPRNPLVSVSLAEIVNTGQIIWVSFYLLFSML